jgi:hypothetical protein
MNGQRYFRKLVSDRIIDHCVRGSGGSTLNAETAPGGGQDRLRFRRMADARKRQMLDRLLLDDGEPGGNA